MESTKKDGEAHETAQPNVKFLVQYFFYFFMYLTYFSQSIRHLSCMPSFRDYYEIVYCQSLLMITGLS